MWNVLLQIALPMIVRAIEGKVGKEAMEALQAGIVYAVTTPGSGDEKRAEAWAYFMQQVSEAKLAVAEEIATGIPWYLNLAFESLVAKAKIAPPAGK